MKTYTQCKIVKDKKCQIAWIPSTYAVINKIIKIKVNGSWENGWKVIDVYGVANKEHVETHERDFTKQRKASDI